jgi:hypothetical protein
VFLDSITIATAVPFLDHVPGLGQVTNDPEGPTLGHTQSVSNLAQTDTGITCDADEHPSVLGHETPLRHHINIDDTILEMAC